MGLWVKGGGEPEPVREKEMKRDNRLRALR